MATATSLGTKSSGSARRVRAHRVQCDVKDKAVDTTRAEQGTCATTLDDTHSALRVLSYCKDSSCSNCCRLNDPSIHFSAHLRHISVIFGCIMAADTNNALYPGRRSAHCAPGIDTVVLVVGVPQVSKSPVLTDAASFWLALRSVALHLFSTHLYYCRSRHASLICRLHCEP